MVDQVPARAAVLGSADLLGHLLQPLRQVRAALGRGLSSDRFRGVEWGRVGLLQGTLLGGLPRLALCQPGCSAALGPRGLEYRTALGCGAALARPAWAGAASQFIS